MRAGQDPVAPPQTTPHVLGASHPCAVAQLAIGKRGRLERMEHLPTQFHGSIAWGTAIASPVAHPRIGGQL